jgi:hypothetical protein
MIGLGGISSAQEAPHPKRYHQLTSLAHHLCRWTPLHQYQPQDKCSKGLKRMDSSAIGINKTKENSDAY